MRPLLRAVALRGAVLLGLGLVAYGVRAAGPDTADSRSWSASGVLDSDGLVVGLGVAAAAALVFVLLQERMGGKGRQPRARRSPLTTVAALLLFAAALGLRLLLHKPSKGLQVRPIVDVTERPKPSAPTQASHAMAHGPGAAAIVVLVVLVAVLVGLGTAMRRRLLVAADEEISDDALAQGLAAAADVLRMRRDDLAPRERVMQAYAAFEQALAARGVVRGRSGTPGALLQRAVQVGAPPEPAAALTDVFGRARYSVEEITEADVDLAERCLAELQATA